MGCSGWVRATSRLYELVVTIIYGLGTYFVHEKAFYSDILTGYHATLEDIPVLELRIRRRRRRRALRGEGGGAEGDGGMKV